MGFGIISNYIYKNNFIELVLIENFNKQESELMQKKISFIDDS